MKKITKTFEVYNFSELSEESQDIAINNHINYLTEIGWDGEEYVPGYVQEAIDKCEELKTPLFFAQYIYEFGKDIIVLELEDYEFYKDGKTYHE